MLEGRESSREGRSVIGKLRDRVADGEVDMAGGRLWSMYYYVYILC